MKRLHKKLFRFKLWLYITIAIYNLVIKALLISRRKRKIAYSFFLNSSMHRLTCGRVVGDYFICSGRKGCASSKRTRRIPFLFRRDLSSELPFSLHSLQQLENLTRYLNKYQLWKREDIHFCFSRRY